jgi:hypothetical protein
MADYIIHGKKGNGKSLVVVGRIRDALLAGKKVATNLDLTLENLLPPGHRAVECYRLPDHPTIDDLEALGKGSEQIDESSYGLIVLDETAAMLNARTFGDKGRQSLLNYFVHSRKLGWDTYFICQNPAQIDKQVRESLVELSVSCKRLDRLRIPFIGPFTKHVFGFELRAPKVHVATVRYGLDRDALISDRWTYMGRDLYAGYDTRQVFRDDYDSGLYCYLSPWHVKGRYMEKIPMRLSQRLKAWLRSSPPVTPSGSSKHPLVALLTRLPADQRIKHLKRLEALGAFSS